MFYLPFILRSNVFWCSSMENKLLRTKGNRHKDELLGMPHGTANGILRKDIIFWLAGISGMLTCFRCGKLIESVEEFSIEHKHSWQTALDPKREFFDVKNIAFSHFKCNVGHGNRSKTHCANGHRFDKVLKDGYKCCSICRKQDDRESKRRTYSPEKRRTKYLLHGY